MPRLGLVIPGCRLIIPGLRLVIPSARLVIPGLRLVIPGPRLVIPGLVPGIACAPVLAGPARHAETPAAGPPPPAHRGGTGARSGPRRACRHARRHRAP